MDELARRGMAPDDYVPGTLGEMDREPTPDDDRLKWEFDEWNIYDTQDFTLMFMESDTVTNVTALN